MNALDLKSIKHEIIRLKNELQRINSSEPSSSQAVYKQPQSAAGMYGSNERVSSYNGNSQGGGYQQGIPSAPDHDNQQGAVNSIIQRLEAIRMDLGQCEQRCRSNATVVNTQQRQVREVRGVQAKYQEIERVIQNEIRDIQGLIREIDTVLKEAKQKWISHRSPNVRNLESIDAAVASVSSASQSEASIYQTNLNVDGKLSLLAQEGYGRNSSGKTVQGPSPSLASSGLDSTGSTLERFMDGGFFLDPAGLSYAKRYPKHPYKKFYQKGLYEYDGYSYQPG